jgi:HK97 gp10 family phage protein
MADGISFKMDGVDELNAKLKGLTQDLKYKGGRFALRKAAQVLVAKAKENAKSLDDEATAEDVSKNITERWNGRLFKATGSIGFRIGLMGGSGGNLSRNKLSGLPGGDTRYWRYLEFGTEKMQATPFMRPVIDTSGQDAVNTFIREYDKAATRALRRLEKKNK